MGRARTPTQSMGQLSLSMDPTQRREGARPRQEASPLGSASTRGLSSPEAAGFFLFRSNRLERLTDLLVERLWEQSPADPLVPARIVVGSRGMDRWLRHQLAQGLGVCANVELLFPSRALAELSSQILGVDAPALDPWAPDALAWAILGALPDLVAAPELEAVRRYTGALDGVVSRRAYGLGRELGDVIDRYVHFRRDWVEAWSRGSPAGGIADEATEAWQRALFRALEARLGATHFAARAADLERALEAGARLAQPAPTIHVFGVTSMSPAFLAQLAHLSAQVRVELYLLGPSDLYWGDLRTKAQRLRAARAQLRSFDAVAPDEEASPQNPLLTALGRVSRDAQLVLEELPGGYREEGESLFVDPCPSGACGSLLTQLQSDLLLLRSVRELDPDTLAGRLVHSGDASIRVHVCHGPTRQVEVLREALLGLFADHPDLEPRDVVVMTPDIETFAPLVAGVFAQGEAKPASEGPTDERWGAVGAPRLPVEIADLGLRRTNPVADALFRVLELTEARVTASAVLDLLALAPVRARFGIEVEDLDVVVVWLREGGVRWGIDAADRAQVGQPEDGTCTFQFGLERLALGVTMPDDDALFEGVSPYDDMEGDNPDLFGRFAAFCRTLFAAVASLRTPRPVPEWMAELRRTVLALTEVDAKASFLREQVRVELHAVEEQAARAGFTASLELGALRDALAGRFELPRGGDRPITGAVTVCALMPMRSVPFRVVCLLGMDDGAFPRAKRNLGVDLMPAHERPGDRDVRDEDRHLILEALLSARSHLHLFYTGHDVHTNAELPPAVPVAELLDVIDASFTTSEPGVRPRDRVVLHHPLQPFSPRSFAAVHLPPSGSESPRPRPWSFDRRMRDAAVVLGKPRNGSVALFEDGKRGAPLSQLDVTELSLDDLAAFVRQPVRYLLNRRLGLYLRDEADALEDRELTEVGPLTAWSLAHQLLAWAVAQRRAPVDLDWEGAYALFAARGRLPLGAAGRRTFAASRKQVELALSGAAEELLKERRQIDVSIVVSGVRLSGSVRHVDRDGEVLELGHDSVDKPRRLLQAWVRLLAIHAADPSNAHGVRLVGTRGAAKDAAAVVAVLEAPDDAHDRLAALVSLYREGMRRPLLLFEKTSYAFFDALDEGSFDASTAKARGLAKQRAEAAWGEGASFEAASPEGREPDLHAVFPDEPPFLDAEGELEPDFIALSEALWQPLFAARQAAE